MTTTSARLGKPMSPPSTAAHSSRFSLISQYRFEFYQLDGTVMVIDNQAQLSHTFSAQGVYRVKLRVRDQLGAARFDEVYINAGSAPAPEAVIQASDLTSAAPLSVDFDASQSITYLGAPITHYDWNFGDGAVASGLQVNRVYQVPGDYEAKLTITDSDGRHSTASTVIEVSQGVPKIDVKIRVTQNGQGNSTVSFGALASPIGPIPWPPQSLRYAWNFGDGTTGLGQGVNHTYATTGPFTVALLVTDEFGRFGVVKRKINNVSSAQSNQDLNFLLLGSIGPAPFTVHTDIKNFPLTVNNFKSFRYIFSPTVTVFESAAFHTYSAEGSFDVVLRATNLNGFDINSVPQTVQVVGQRPLIEARINATSSSGGEYSSGDTIHNGRMPEVLNLSAAFSSRVGGEIAEYIWTTPSGVLNGKDVNYVATNFGTHAIELIVRDTMGNEDTENITLIVGQENCLNEEGQDICPAIENSRRDILDFSQTQWTILTQSPFALKEKFEQIELFEGSNQSWIGLRGQDGQYYNLSLAAEVSGHNIVLNKTEMQSLDIPLDKSYAFEVFVIDDQGDTHSGEVLDFKFGVGSVVLMGAPSSVVLEVFSAQAGYQKQITLVPGASATLTGLPVGFYQVSAPVDLSFDRSFEITVDSRDVVVDLSEVPIQGVALRSSLVGGEELLERPNPLIVPIKIDEPMTLARVQTAASTVIYPEGLVHPPTDCFGVPLLQVPTVTQEEISNDFWRSGGASNLAELVSDQKDGPHNPWDGKFAKVAVGRFIEKDGRTVLPIRCINTGSPWQAIIEKLHDDRYLCCQQYVEDPIAHGTCLRNSDVRYQQRLAPYLALESKLPVKKRFTIRDKINTDNQVAIEVSTSYDIQVVKQYGGAEELLKKGWTDSFSTFGVFQDYDLPLPPGITQPELKADVFDTPSILVGYPLCFFKLNPKGPRITEIAKLSAEVVPSLAQDWQPSLRFFDPSHQMFPLDSEFGRHGNLPPYFVPPETIDFADRFKVDMRVRISPRGFGVPQKFELSVKNGGVEEVFDILGDKFSLITSGIDLSPTLDSYKVTVDLRDVMPAFASWSPLNERQDTVTFGLRAVYSRPALEPAELRSNTKEKTMPASFNWLEINQSTDPGPICANGTYGIGNIVGWGRASFLHKVYRFTALNPEIGLKGNDISHPFGGFLKPHPDGHKTGRELDLRYFNKVESARDEYDTWVTMPCGCDSPVNDTCLSPTKVHAASGKSRDLRQVIDHTDKLFAMYFVEKLNQPILAKHQDLTVECNTSKFSECSLLKLNPDDNSYDFSSIRHFCYNLAISRPSEDVASICGRPEIQAMRNLSDYVEINRTNLTAIANGMGVGVRIIIGFGNDFALGGKLTCLKKGWHQRLLEKGLLPVSSEYKDQQILKFVNTASSGSFSDYVTFWVDEPGSVTPREEHVDHFHLGVFP